ncbi:MAG TPA: primosomal replication protein N [Sideroxyarcus sp.]|nr:primosomal replication protein N [Sideroxyarcus sp.]
MSSNRCVIDGVVAELEGLRYTPAGLARVAFKLRHSSMQQEAGMQRQVQCEVPALALGEAAQQASRLQTGQQVRAEGFLAQRSLKIAQLVLHVDNVIEIGAQHGSCI